MRSKEEANDYRYFPEPDLVPLAPDAAWQERVRAGLGAMPADRRAVLAPALGGAPTEAEKDQIHAVVDLGLDTLVTTAADAGVPVALALARAANEVAAQGQAGRALDPGTYAAALAMESDGQLSATQSKAVLGALLERGGGDPAAVAKEMGFEALASDTLGAVLDEVDRRPRRRMGALRRGRRQVDGFLHRGGHEGHLGEGEREGSGGGATEPPRLTCPAASRSGASLRTTARGATS